MDGCRCWELCDSYRGSCARVRVGNFRQRCTLAPSKVGKAGLARATISLVCNQHVQSHLQVTREQEQKRIVL